MDEFNDLIGKQGYSEEQLNMCRDIRKRGKNKVRLVLFVVFFPHISSRLSEKGLSVIKLKKLLV